MQTLMFLFGLSGNVNRKQYFFWGLGLMAIKYGIDFLALYIAQEHLLTPLEFLNPVLSQREKIYSPPGASIWPLVISYILSLLMLWIGLSMTVRRALDAGKAPWLALIFFLPYVNLILMIALSILPSTPLKKNKLEKKMASNKSVQRTIVLMTVFGLLGTAMMASIVFGVRSYGSVLFAGAPFAIGTALGYYLNRDGFISKKQTLLITAGTLCIWAGFILLFALEGLVCIFMAAPIVLVMASLGALLGRYLAKNQLKPSKLSVIAHFPALVLMAAVESKVSPVLWGEVKSSIVIDSNVQNVWKNVVEFPELSKPTELIFKAGISYPIRARIEGSGKGAIRYCEFNSGAFVEPITVWDENKRLSFDVEFQPRPMKELSIWESIEAPHLDGFFQSRRGEFRLSSIEGGKTLLEGSTWYSLNILPSPYWRLYAEWIVHNIHLRVLKHIKLNAEKLSISQL
jgi:uncharacterized membrane protein YhaH (DUF805 family)